MADLIALCFDANDPPRLARFWGEALLWESDDETRDVICLVPTDGTKFQVAFRPLLPPGPKVGKNSIHLDLTTSSIDDQNETVARLLGLGARHIDIGQGRGAHHVVLADPEGNEFCVIEPKNSFLAGCARLGSITCDGSPSAGHFWSKALGWPLVWDQNEQTAIRDLDGTNPFITWGPPIPPKASKNRLHLDITPSDQRDQQSEIDHLVSVGATRVDIGRQDGRRAVMADPDGNLFSVTTTP